MLKRVLPPQRVQKHKAIDSLLPSLFLMCLLCFQGLILFLPSILFWNINKIINLNSNYSSAFSDRKPTTGLAVGNRVRAQSRGARSCHHDNVSTINIARPMCRDAQKQSFILRRTAKRACSALRGCCGPLVPLEEGDASPSFTVRHSN